MTLAFFRFSKRVARLFLLPGWLAMLGSCTTFEESGLPGSAASMAKDQIMLVREEPATLGYYRLTSQMRIFPDFAFFVKKRGNPDFIAETSDRYRSYFILYYLKARRAYACRTRISNPDSMEFSGPYPITRQEMATLRDMMGEGAEPPPPMRIF